MSPPRSPGNGTIFLGGPPLVKASTGEVVTAEAFRKRHDGTVMDSELLEQSLEVEDTFACCLPSILSLLFQHFDGLSTAASSHNPRQPSGGFLRSPDPNHANHLPKS